MALVTLLLGGLIGAALVAAAILLTQESAQPGAGNGVAVEQTSAADPRARVVTLVLADTTDVWHRVFEELGGLYAEPRVVLFDGGAESACGLSDAGGGLFYCADDRTLYVDLDFLEALRKLGGSGELAQAYVVAHAVGHHVQMLIGITQEVEELRRPMMEGEAERLSLMIELQADCFAGLWAGQIEEANRFLTPVNLDSAIEAATRIGGERAAGAAQDRMPGRGAPENFSHGSAEQRTRWFTTGFETGSVDACDTFNASEL